MTSNWKYIFSLCHYLHAGRSLGDRWEMSCEMTWFLLFVFRMNTIFVVCDKIILSWMGYLPQWRIYIFRVWYFQNSLKVLLFVIRIFSECFLPVSVVCALWLSCQGPGSCNYEFQDLTGLRNSKSSLWLYNIVAWILRYTRI